MTFPKRIRCLARAHLAVLCASALAVGMAAVARAADVVVVTSRDDGPYADVISGVTHALDARSQVSVRVHSLQSQGDDAIQALRAARRGDAPLVTVGSNATQAAIDAPGKAPVIACMIVDANHIEKASNATGVVLEFPFEVQFAFVRRFVPGSQAIGLLYNPAENRERVAEAHRVAARLGLRLVAREVEKPQDLPDALASLAREADVLLAVTDQTVLSSQTAQAILLFSFRNRMPFTGLSASWVKAGALYALERDYRDLGAQCGEMALEVLGGRSAASLRPATPRKVVYAVNVKTAEHLRLRLPTELVDDAMEVFR